MRQRLTDQNLLKEEVIPRSPVECLGMTFENNEVRRAYFLDKLREGLKELHTKLRGMPYTTVEDAVVRMQSVEKWPMGDEAHLRGIAERMRNAGSGEDLLQHWKNEVGFPHGEIEDILRLSDPPYYTACPNPFMTDFINRHSKPYAPKYDEYHREPFAADVSEGKGGAVYKAHTYHTKVPHEAIARYILYYTQPGDIVLDAFAGSGMTGVAASVCGYPDPLFRASIESSQPNVHWGSRKAILIDLSPFATFLSHSMTRPLSVNLFRKRALQLLETVEREVGQDLYGVPPASYIVWSQTLICPECGHSFPFAEVAIADSEAINTQFSCPSCMAAISKSVCQPKQVAYFDPLCGRLVKQNEYVPVWVAVKNSNTRIQPLRETDRIAIARASKLTIVDVPVAPMMFNGEIWGDMYRAGYHFGVTHVHHFWTWRNLAVLSRLWRLADEGIYPNQMRLLLTSFMVKTGSRMHNIGMKDGKINLAGQIFNTLQIPSIYAERNIFELASGKIDDLLPIFSLNKGTNDCLIGTSSATELNISKNSIDYIFVDPPFGKNIMYSEMSFLYEAWLRVYTNSSKEAIISEIQNKDINKYRTLMIEAFAMLYYVLKPGRWMTVAFHNSKNEVWNALQESLIYTGFVIADVRILDKKQGTFKQMTTAGAVKQDLVISVYKPNSGIEERFKLSAGTEEGLWDFVRTHLHQLPIFVQSKDGRAEVIAERMNYLLFDRMVAFHVQRRVTVPLSASGFYAGLAQRFPERDGMYFLPEQVVEYDKKRMTVKEILQIQLFVTDESSAIQWLRQQLTRKPQTFQEIHPQFLRELGGWQKHEKALELFELLEENFLRYDGRGPIPEQIWSWLQKSATLRERMKGQDRETPDASLRAEAKDRWYVPDPNKAQDLERLRERNLLREFEEYKAFKGRQLKVFRLEAVRAGFKKAWAERDYETILDVAAKIPEQVLQGDPKLLMWYDQALTRTESNA
jgi:DNA modification methylase